MTIKFEPNKSDKNHVQKILKNVFKLIVFFCNFANFFRGSGKMPLKTIKLVIHIQIKY